MPDSVPKPTSSTGATPRTPAKIGRYEVVERLGSGSTGTVYRALRQMEGLGLVSSIWDTSSAGPARRMYSMTQAGNLFLQNWLTLLNLHRATLERFLSGFGGGEPR